MTACDRHDTRITQWSQGELDEAGCAELRAHARNCPCCARSMDVQQRMMTALREEAQAAPPALYFDGLLAQIHAQMPAQPAAERRAARPRRRPMRHHFASALMLLLLGVPLASLLGVGLPDWSASGNTATPAPQISARPVVSAPPGRPMRLIADADFGLVSENSPLLKLSPEMRRELGAIYIRIDNDRIQRS